MKKKLLFYFVLICSSISYGQLACPTPTGPSDGDSNVTVDTTITWNGNFNGKPLPASDYWFETISSKNKKNQSHFSLKR